MSNHTSSRGQRAALGVITALLATFLSALLAPSAEATDEGPAVWIGSPVDGSWGVPGDASTTPAGQHHLLTRPVPQNDWSVDLSSLGDDDGRKAYLYAAPNDTSLDNAITAKVRKIEPSCTAGGGGHAITVDLYDGSLLIGNVTFAHLDVDPSLQEGQGIARWGTYLGRAGDYENDENCWTGPHVHTELRSEKNYACWNHGYDHAGYPVKRTNFIGFIGGNYASGAYQPCP